MPDIRVFGDLSTRYLALMADDRAAEAYALVLREGDRFPQEAWHVAEWRALGAAYSGDLAGGIEHLRAGLAAGLWYPVARLRRAAMAPFRGDPAFEAMVDQCAAREAAARCASAPHLEIRLGSNNGPHAPLLVMHRNHSHVRHELVCWSPAVDAGYGLAMPLSSQVAGPDVHVWDDRSVAVPEVMSHFRTLAADPRFDVRRTIWAGFMTGADVALRAAFSPQAQTRGVIALSPYTSDLDTLGDLLEASRDRRPPVYVFIGAEDARCLPGAKALAEYLIERGLPVRLRVEPDFTFGYPEHFTQVLSEALNFVRLSQPL